MRKNGFTLIELLAVIVILAIIALIATPIVLNIIEDTKNSATLRSADFYIDAVELAIAEKVLEGGTIDGEYTINSSGNICKDEDCIEVEVQGSKPTSGKITIEDGKIKNIYKLTLDNKKISTDSSGELAIKKYSTYNITYENINNTSGLITVIEEGETAIIDLTGRSILKDTLVINTEEYIYENDILKIPNVEGDIKIAVIYRNLFDKDTMVTANQGISGQGVIGSYNWGLARVPVKENTQYSIQMIDNGTKNEEAWYNCALVGAFGFADSTGNNLISFLAFSPNQAHVDAGTNGANALLSEYSDKGGMSAGNIGWVTFTTPAGCSYLLFNTTIKTTQVQLEKGDIIHNYYLPYDSSLE